MRTLLIESSPGVGAAAAEQLTRAGAEVVRCHEPSSPAFPCREIAVAGSCPLSGSARPDVVLAVRAPADPVITGEEAGVSCALRHGVPVVVDHDPVAGANPFGDLVAEVAGGELVATCEAAIEAGRDRSAAPLVAEVVRLLKASGAGDAAVEVAVFRSGAICRIEVTVPAEAPPADDAIAVRVHGRYRQLERDGAAEQVEVRVRRREPSGSIAPR